jgi:hypothetical protein
MPKGVAFFFFASGYCEAGSRPTGENATSIYVRKKLIRNRRIPDKKNPCVYGVRQQSGNSPEYPVVLPVPVDKKKFRFG